MSPSSPTRSRQPDSKGKSVTLANHKANERLRDDREKEEEHDQKITTTTTSDNFSSLTKQKVVLIERAKSLTKGWWYKSSKSQWALSPGRSGPPPISVESKNRRPFSFSTLRPHNSQNKILSFHFDLFSSNKSSTSSPLPHAVHHLRLLNNRLLQWRFANSKAHAVNHCVSRQAERNFIYAMYGFTKLQRSVLQKKMQLQKEKLEMKLNFVLHSQMELLEVWGGGDMESQHVAAIDVMKDHLDSVVCKVPLLEGAKVDIQLASFAQRHATDLTDSIMSILSNFLPSADKTAEMLSELTKVIAQEKLLSKEINNILRNMCVLEIKESSLKCSLIQLKFLVEA